MESQKEKKSFKSPFSDEECVYAGADQSKDKQAPPVPVKKKKTDAAPSKPKVVGKPLSNEEYEDIFASVLKEMLPLDDDPDSIFLNKVLPLDDDPDSNPLIDNEDSRDVSVVVLDDFDCLLHEDPALAERSVAASSGDDMEAGAVEVEALPEEYQLGLPQSASLRFTPVLHHLWAIPEIKMNRAHLTQCVNESSPLTAENETTLTAATPTPNPPKQRSKKLPTKQNKGTPKHLKFSSQEQHLKSPVRLDLEQKGSPAGKNDDVKLKKSKVSKKQIMLERQIQETGTWVQCSDTECHKWRFLDDICDPAELHDVWTCDMNNDRRYNSCETEEQSWDADHHDEDYIFTRFTEGSVVWARMAGYPWWPAMVEMDPDYETYFECRVKDNVVSHYHVVFFDDKVSRAWLGLSNLRPFSDNHNLLEHTKKSADHKKAVAAAQEKALAAHALPLVERLKQFSFCQRFHGRWGSDQVKSASQGASSSRRGTKGRGSKKRPRGDAGAPLSLGLDEGDLDCCLGDTEAILRNTEALLEEFMSNEDGSDYQPDNPAPKQPPKQQNKEKKSKIGPGSTSTNKPKKSHKSKDKEPLVNPRKPKFFAPPTFDPDVFTMETDDTEAVAPPRTNPSNKKKKTLGVPKFSVSHKNTPSAETFQEEKAVAMDIKQEPMDGENVSCYDSTNQNEAAVIGNVVVKQETNASSPKASSEHLCEIDKKRNLSDSKQQSELSQGSNKKVKTVDTVEIEKNDIGLGSVDKLQSSKGDEKVSPKTVAVSPVKAVVKQVASTEAVAKLTKKKSKFSAPVLSAAQKPTKVDSKASGDSQTKTERNAAVSSSQGNEGDDLCPPSGEGDLMGVSRVGDAKRITRSRNSSVSGSQALSQGSLYSPAPSVTSVGSVIRRSQRTASPIKKVPSGSKQEVADSRNSQDIDVLSLQGSQRSLRQKVRGNEAGDSHSQLFSSQASSVTSSHRRGKTTAQIQPAATPASNHSDSSDFDFEE